MAKKIKKLGVTHEWIEVAVEFSGLVSLVCATYNTVNKVLLFAFVERWHPNTIYFHLPRS